MDKGDRGGTSLSPGGGSHYGDFSCLCKLENKLNACLQSKCNTFANVLVVPMATATQSLRGMEDWGGGWAQDRFRVFSANSSKGHQFS